MILRPETEWIEIVAQGAAVLIDAEFKDLNKNFELFRSKTIEYPKLFGDGASAEFICQKIIEQV